LKYLLVLALIALLVWFLYRRLRPYIQLVRQFLGAFKGTLDLGSRSSDGDLGEDLQSARSRLVRCRECNTWVPMNRAIQASSDYYCSTGCLKKAPATKRRKTAG
jgi:Sec-independent protein translocase protein TatA